MSNSNKLDVVIWYLGTGIFFCNSFLALGKYFTNSILEELLCM